MHKRAKCLSIPLITPKWRYKSTSFVSDPKQRVLFIKIVSDYCGGICRLKQVKRSL